uniref:Lactate/malate dehydrogenase C-terminal domain-containing protein n=1 Tax=Glossina austeni TaxID=7395 RepID=A0A1A9UM50_GLOAU
MKHMKSPRRIHAYVHCGTTLCLCAESKAAICEGIKNVGDVVIKAQLSINYATKLLFDFLLYTLDGVTGIFSTAFSAPNATKASFFSSKFRLYTSGVCEILKLPPMDSVKENMLEFCLKSLVKDISEGIEQAKKDSLKTLWNGGQPRTLFLLSALTLSFIKARKEAIIEK